MVGELETFAYTPPPASAVMRTPTERDSHDQTIISRTCRGANHPQDSAG